MKGKLTTLSRQYEAALQTHLKRGVPHSLRAAKAVGRDAITLKLETLDLARIHERALISLVLRNCSPGTREVRVRRAGRFFAEAIIPIENTHRAALESSIQLRKLNDRLRKRSTDLASSNKQLKDEITQRKTAEESLRKSEVHYSLLLERSRLMQEQLRLLSRELLSAQEEERKKISRELHDVIAQTLTSINVRLGTLQKEAVLSTKGLAASIARTQLLVEQSVNIVHRFARELRPRVLDDLGVIPALHTFMKSFREETGICVSLSAFAGVELVNGDQRTVLYRVAQEALTNVARHAHATRADVEIERRNGSVYMKIRDNGKGFQQERLLEANNGRRLGLLGMRERLEMVGGRLSVISKPGKGTTVLAEMPVQITAEQVKKVRREARGKKKVN